MTHGAIPRLTASRMEALWNRVQPRTARHLDGDLLRRFVLGEPESFELLFRHFEVEVFRWGPVHSGRCGLSARHGLRCPRAERGISEAHGLLLALDEGARDARATGRFEPHDARLHARKRLAGR